MKINKKHQQNETRHTKAKKKNKIANGDEFHRALLLEAQHSINNNLNLTIVQNMTYRGRQGRVISEITFDLSDIY